jgi:glyoxylase-like metal-dependent hydrolase (beta-lactamase superfamily II)
MAWIISGALGPGRTSLYPADALVKQGVAAVRRNYRMGRLKMLLRRLGPLMALLALAAAAYGQQTFPEPRKIKINDRVYVFLGPIQHANRLNQGYMINSTVIVGDKGVILIDSGGSDEVGRHIATALRQITDKPVTHVVNTHHHGDHYLGNVAFEEAMLISSEMCRKMVLETGHEWLGIMERAIGRKLPGTRPLAAEVAYPAGTRTETFIHGVRLVFWVPQGSHTVGDLLVHLPDDKVLVAGDVLVNGIVPTFQDGFIQNWIRTLDEIIALDVAHFVPGHGDLMTLRDITALRGAIFRFYSGVEEGFRKGQSEAAIRKSLDLSNWEKLERSYVIGRNINRAYLEIEADSFDK